MYGVDPQIIPLPAEAQRRGYSCPLPDQLFQFLGAVREMHMASIDSGKVRGNHVHHAHNEALIVRHDSAWIFAWQFPGEPARQQAFTGQGIELLLIPAGLIHALKNSGDAPVHLVSCSDSRIEAGNTSWHQLLAED